MAIWLLRQINHLYRIERKLRRTKSGFRLRTTVRAHQSKPVLRPTVSNPDRLKIKRRYLPRSGLGMAIAYIPNWMKEIAKAVKG